MYTVRFFNRCHGKLHGKNYTYRSLKRMDTAKYFQNGLPELAEIFYRSV
jgi:hypothetical protein